MIFRVTILWCVVAMICASCRNVPKQNDNTRTVTDSIAILLSESASQPDSAFAYLERALQLSQQKNQKRSVLFEIYYRLGTQSEKAGNYDLAALYFKDAVKFSNRANMANTGTAYNYIGQIALRQGKHYEAIEYFPKALNIRIRLNDIEGQASSHRNIGAAYQKGERYAQAHEHYELSLKLYASLNNEHGKIDVLNNLGGLWLEQNKPQQALNYYLEIEKISNNSEQLWNVYNNIGLTYLIMNEIEQAREYYFKMLQQSHSLFSPAILAETYHSMGAFFDDIQQSDSAIYYYSKAIEIAHESKLYEVLYHTLEKRCYLYATEGEYREAYFDMRVRGEAYDAVQNSDMVKAFTQKSMQYEFEVQQEQQVQQNRMQKKFIIALSAVVILVGAVGIVSYRGFVQKKKANSLLAEQNSLLEWQKKEITDSIRYAGLIQKAILPPKEYSDAVLPEHFIYYKPRDIVSGDFYWINRRDDHIIVAAADCTGHGVPGAIVSMLGISALAKVAGTMEVPKADLILNELRNEIIHLLNNVQDGMDIALVVIHTKIKEMEYAGAYNPLFLIRDGQLIEKKANQMPIGLHIKNEETFTADRFSYQSGDIIYIFSDGYADQFGGADGKKFKTKNFKNLLLDISNNPMEQQALILDATHTEWRGTHPQVDDILVIGIKLS